MNALDRGRRLLLAMALASAAACDGGAPDPSKPGPTFPVVTVPVERGEVEELLETFGTVELDPEHLQTLTSPRSGEVGRVHVVPGASVQKSEVLLDLQPVPAGSLEAERARIDLDFATRDVERVRRMAKLKLATNQEVQTAEKQLEASRVALASLGLDGKGVHLVAAGAKGVVSEILVSEGALVQPGEELLRLAAMGSVAVRVGFEVEEMPRLSEGLMARVEPVFGSSGDGLVTARLSRLHQVADPATQLVEGLIRVETPPTWAVAGTRVRLQVVLQAASNVPRIPRAALLAQESGDVVFVAEGGKARRRVIEVGVGGSDWVEVRSGLSQGQAVVTEGRSTLHDGALVRVVH